MPRHRLSERYGLPAAAPAAPRLQPFPQYPDYQGQQLRDNLLNQKVDQIPLQNDMLEAKAARAKSQEAQARYKLQKEVETDRQKAAFYNGLQELESSLNQRGLKIGSREHAEAFAAYAHEFPLARSSSDVQQALKLHALVADDQAALKQRINALQPPPEKINERYSRVGGTLEQYQTAYDSDVARQKAANMAANKANEPYNPALDKESRIITSNLAGAKRESELLQQSYPQLSGQAQQIQPAAASASTPEPSSTPTTQPIATPDQTPIYTPSPSPEARAAPTVDHSAAINWATANPDDPRSKVILERAQSMATPLQNEDQNQ